MGLEPDMELTPNKGQKSYSPNIDLELTPHLCYLQNSIFYPITLYQVIRFEKNPSQTGVVFSR